MNHATVAPARSSDESVAARAGAYRLFARLLCEAPSEGLLRGILEQDLFGREEQAGTEQIALEYARLFVVPGKHVVRPYESVYCDVLTIDTSTACSPYFQSEPQGIGFNGFLGGPSSVAVREAYRQVGLELAPAAHELPDHLGVELEFMGWLLEHGQTNQARVFFVEHLGRWVYNCVSEIKQKAHSWFYRSVAEKLECFLKDEQETLTIA